MPATAGRVRMPANNRVHSSAALQTHGIWQSAIGYDPYAPNKDDSKDASHPKSSMPEPEAENAYASFQGLLALARLSGSNAAEVRGACKKCNRVGHLTYQCRNFISVKDDIKYKDREKVQYDALVMDKLKNSVGKVKRRTAVSSSESSDEESENSDSDVDSEIERIIAKRAGKKGLKMMSDDYDEIGYERNRGREKKRSARSQSDSGSDSEVERRRKHHRRDKCSSKDHRHRHRSKKSRKHRRRHQHDSDDSDREHRRKKRGTVSSSDSDSVARDQIERT